MTVNSKTVDLAIAVVAEDCFADDMREFLNADPEHSKVGRKAERRILKYIKRIKADENTSWKRVQNILGRAAILILAVSAAAFGLMMSSEAFRSAVGEFWVKFYDDHIGIYIGKDNSTGGTGNLFEPRYVPDGWTVEVTEVNDYSRAVAYYSDIGEIYILQKVNNGTESVFIDDNYESSEEINIYGDVDGHLYRYSDEIILVCSDGGYIYTATSNVPVETVLDIIRNNK